MKNTIFRSAGLATLAAAACTLLSTPLAHADVPPPPVCTGDVQLTAQIRANVCLQLESHDTVTVHGYATADNTSTGTYDATVRVDLVSDTTTHYGNACAKTLTPNGSMFCSSPTIPWAQAGPHLHARARIQAPGYLEYIFSP